MKLTNEKLAYELSYKNFTVKAFWGDERDARIEITRDGNPYRCFMYPAYRIFNIQAHFDEMVERTLAEEAEPTELLQNGRKGSA